MIAEDVLRVKVEQYLAKDCDMNDRSLKVSPDARSWPWPTATCVYVASLWPAQPGPLAAFISEVPDSLPYPWDLSLSPPPCRAPQGFLKTLTYVTETGQHQ